MSIDPDSLTLVLQTVRLPGGNEQFVIPDGVSLSRECLRDRLASSTLQASHQVQQPETGRIGTERLVMLAAGILPEAEADKASIWMKDCLRQIESVLDDARNSASLGSGQIPQSKTLARWNDEARSRFSGPLQRTKTPQRSTESVGGNKHRWLAVTFIIAMIMAGVLIVGQIGNLFNKPPGRFSPEPPKPKSDPMLVKWNFSRQDEFDREALHQQLAPLVASTADNDQSSPLLPIMSIIQNVAERKTVQSAASSAENRESQLLVLLTKDSLSEFTRGFFDAEGNLNRFAKLESDSRIAQLRVLIPKSTDRNTATQFRDLARQLMSIDALDDQPLKLTEMDAAFAPLVTSNADEKYRDLLRSTPERWQASSETRHSFFTKPDLEAAEAIYAYFESIEFVSADGLGFTDPNKSLLVNYIAKDVANPAKAFAALLGRWKAFASETPNTQQAINTTADDTNE